jgi:hypothetical protein
VLHGNTGVTYGGGIDAVLLNTVNFVNVTMTGNFINNSGGALAIRGASTVSFAEECVFESNCASAVGGAIAVLSSAMWTVEVNGSLVLKTNVASRGSALFFFGLLSTDETVEELHDIEMTGNVASVGGTVFWLVGSSMTDEPPGLNSSSVLFNQNVAAYGEVVATQALVLVVPTEYSVQEYATVLDPPISMHMVDFYDQVVRIDGFSSVTVSVLDPQEDDCGGLRAYVAGADTVGSGLEFVHGVVDFSQLLVQCNPQGSLLLQFEAQLGNLAKIPQQMASSYYIRNQTTLQFRGCRTGEIYASGMCVSCPVGTFSLEGEVTETTECEPCTSEEGVESCWADQLILSEVSKDRME